jgi:Domain of unknown function (DUF222)
MFESVGDATPEDGASCGVPVVPLSGEELTQALVSMPPGPGLAMVLGTVDESGLSGFDLVSFLSACERQTSWTQARQLAGIRELARRRPAPIEPGGPEHRLPADQVSEFAQLEIAAELDLSHRAAEGRLGLALCLDLLPGTRAALATGAISWAKADALTDTLGVLADEGVRAEVEARLLGRAPGRTAAELRAAAHRAVLAADPKSARDRHARRRADRRVWLSPAADGMAELGALLPAPAARAFYDALTALAEQAKAPGEDRSLDQRRADALGDLGLLTLGRPDLPRRHGRRPHLQVTVAASTLLGVDEAPGELAGYGPITAEMAREIAADATWRRILTDPRSGAVLEVGATGYQPAQALRDRVIARHRTCRFPGCRIPAERCQLDHVIPFPQGPTAEPNLGPLSARCHRAKHQAGWQAVQHPDGAYTWTSPTGHTYTQPLDPPLEPPPPPPGADPPPEPPAGDEARDHGPPDDDIPPF